MLVKSIKYLNLDLGYFNVRRKTLLFLQMPKVQYKSNCKPSTFAYPAPLEVPKEKEKEKVGSLFP